MQKDSDQELKELSLENIEHEHIYLLNRIFSFPLRQRQDLLDANHNPNKISSVRRSFVQQASIHDCLDKVSDRCSLESGFD